MNSLCFVTTCMGRLAHLKRTLGQVVRQQQSSCVVVDYSCPDRCGDWVEATYPQVRVVRVPGKKTFNRSPAANAGGRAAEAPWICFFDCDVFFDSAFATSILPLLQPGYYYCPDPIRDWGLCGTFICSRRDFERIGGYDEVYKGWGERDLDIYSALEYLGLERRTFPSSWLRHLPHGEESRVRFHEFKSRHIVQSINRIYRFVKFDTMYVTGTFLPQENREILYEKIAEKTKLVISEGRALDLAVEIPGQDFVLKYDVQGAHHRCINRMIEMVYRSSLINGIYRFIKAGMLKRPLNLAQEINGRRLPFGGRLELTFSRKTASGSR